LAHFGRVQTQIALQLLVAGGLAVLASGMPWATQLRPATLLPMVTGAVVLIVGANLADENLELRWEHEPGHHGLAHGSTQHGHGPAHHDRANNNHHGIGVAPGLHLASNSHDEQDSAHNHLAEPLLHGSRMEDDDHLLSLLMAVRATGNARLVPLVEAVEKAHYFVRTQ
jgi:hypothetical protein